MEQEIIVEEKKLLSFGEQLVGIEFNPSNDDRVAKVKSMMAEVANIMKEAYEEERSPIKSLLFDHAVGEIINAQMSVVKLITYKQ